MTTCTTPIEVRYAETDASGIVWHGSYVAWLESARINHMRCLGVEYADFIAAGYNFVVTELEIRYLQPARFGDVVEIESRVTNVQTRRIAFDYTLRRQSSGETLVTAKTTLICVDHSGKVTIIPLNWRQRWLAD